MCLFKVYLEEGGGSRRLVAQEVSAAEKAGGKVRLFSSTLKEVASVEGAEIVRVDTLNEVLLLKAST
ncbi:MAG: hypothetical protein DRO52_03020 [Candidatus Hecatellales archaeon]|nr:MAG: hypothetical protein DRO52_03020 [Candidatus Hecatellales archaeon]